MADGAQTVCGTSLTGGGTVTREELEGFDNHLDVGNIIDGIQDKRDQEETKRLFEEAMKMEYLVPYKSAENELFVITSKEKGKLFPAFSCYEEFKKSGLPGDKVRVMSFALLQKVIAGSCGEIKGVVINPHGKALTFESHVNAPAGNGPEAQKAEGKLHLTKPGMLPQAMTEALCDFFRQNEKVYRAFVLLGQRDSDVAPHLFIVVDFDGKKEEYLPKVAEAVKPFLKQGDSVELAKADFKLLSAAEKTGEPLYRK